MYLPHFAGDSLSQSFYLKFKSLQLWRVKQFKFLIVVATYYWTSFINYGLYHIWWHSKCQLSLKAAHILFYFDIPLNNESMRVLIYPVFQIFAFIRFDFPQKPCMFWVTKAKEGCITSYTGNNWYFSKVLIVLHLAPQFHSDIHLLKKITQYFIQPILQVHV